MVVANMDGPTRDQVLQLMQEKDKIENEIAELNGVLQKNVVGMDDSLVDDNGFPRNDIDVYQVRHARHRIICLQNDHKAIMKQIEKGIHLLHSQQRGSVPSGTSSTSVPQPSVNGRASEAEMATAVGGLHVSERPRPATIAKVNFVSAGSPAEDAGIMIDDEIIEFGSVNATNFRSLMQIGEIVQHSVGSQVAVRILRGSGQLELSLTPRTWSGRGLLGCNILPIETQK